MYTKNKLRPSTKYHLFIVTPSLPGDKIGFAAPALLKDQTSLFLEENEIVDYPPIIVNDNQYCNSDIFEKIVEGAIIAGIRTFLTQKYGVEFNSSNCVWLNKDKPKTKFITYLFTDEEGKIIKITDSDEDSEKGEDL